MGGYNDLKTAITALIRTNDNQEITGATLQSALLSIINTIGQGSVFKGVATTSTNPGSPDADVFYIAGRPGYYPNFNLELTAGLHVIENKSGTWVNTEIALDVVDAINIGGAKHVKPSQAMIIALQSVEQIPDSEGLVNKMWWSTDGHLKYKQSDVVYDLGEPAYVLYYCGDKIYKWTGSGFREIGGGGTFASGEAVSNMSIFDDGSDTDGKSSAQLAAMIPSGEVIKSLLEIISSIDTSGGSYDGIDLITTFSYDAPTRVITVKQSGRQAKTILLPLANSTNAGLMSSEDKTQLANMQNLIGRTVNNFSKSTGETGITITLVTHDNTPYAVLIPIDSELSSQSTSNLVTGAAIYNFLMNGFVYLDQDRRVYAPYTRILPLVSMGSALDNGNTPAQINTNEFRYDPTTKRIYRHNTSSAQPYCMTSTSQLYLNICTGKMYKWAGSDMEEISGGVDPSTLAGKADKHTAADILTPSQWPRVMLYNTESMWGAGGTPPDYESIPVGSIYLDEPDSIDNPPYKRLFYKKTLEGTSQHIDLGAPQENTIYCHITTGKLYRWIPTQNGNDGAFQQIGSSGTVTGVSVNNGQVNTPDQNGVINLDISQSGLQQSDISVETDGSNSFNINVGTDNYHVNLLHTHAGMAKLAIVDEEPSDPALDTIYALVDNAEQPGEIQSLWIAGLEFVGGGGSEDDGLPKMSTPKDGNTINMGTYSGSAMTKVITVRAKNLNYGGSTTGLTVEAVGTGLTLTYGQTTGTSVTIPQADAMIGAQLTINYSGTGALSDGELRFKQGSSVLAVVVVVVVAAPVDLAAIKLTGSQWLKTDYYPNALTEFELECKFATNGNSYSSASGIGFVFLVSKTSNSKYFYHLIARTTTTTTTTVIESLVEGDAGNMTMNVPAASFFADHSVYKYEVGTSNNTIKWIVNGSEVASKSISKKTTTMPDPMLIGYATHNDTIFSIFDLTIYRLTIKENGVNVRNYVPKIVGGVPGLYDTITDTFISSETSTEVGTITVTE
jgi:hypothetical protein